MKEMEQREKERNMRTMAVFYPTLHFGCHKYSATKIATFCQLTDCFHFIACTNSSCTKCAFFPRCFIRFGNSFWYLQNVYEYFKCYTKCQ